MKYLVLLLMIVLLATACQLDPPTDASDQIRIVATLFPQYDFARVVGGDEVDVMLLLPPGVEAHAYEPTPKEMVAIHASDLFVYTGEGMEPWAHRIIQSDPDIPAIDLSRAIEPVEVDDEEDHVGHGHEGEDPHIWTDPTNAMIMVQTIADALSAIRPEKADYFQTNAAAYQVELTSLDESFQTLFANPEDRIIFFAGHNAFGYFAHRYGLSFHSPYEGFSPDAEPSSKRITELMEDMQAHGSKVIYYEELIEPRVAKVIQASTGARMLLLNGAHNISKEDLEAGIGYLDIMKNNLESLKEGQQ